MSDNEALPPSQDMLEEQAPQERPAKKGLRLSSGAMIAIASSLVVAVVIGVGIFGMSRDLAPSTLVTAPELNDTPGGVVQAQSPAYQSALEQANDQNARNALEADRTFLATPEGLMEPVVTPPLEDDVPEFAVTEVTAQRPTVIAVPAPVIPRPVQPEVQTAPAPQQVVQATAQPQQPQPNPYTQRILAQMTQVSAALRPTPSSTQNLEVPEDEQVADAGAGDGTSSAAPIEDVPEILVAPGTILYGETLTTTSSDNAAPVVVEVTTGKFKGAKLIGSYELAQGSDRMVVMFSTMTLSDGETLQTSAYAVDGRTAETAVASDVDQRYLQRYGPVFAAAFVGAFGQSAGRPASQVTEDGISFSAASLEQSAFAGLGAAAGTIAGDLAQQAPKGPLITLQAGWPVGILFVAPAQR